MTRSSRPARKNKKLKIALAAGGAVGLMLIACAAAFFLWGQNSVENKQYAAQIKQEAHAFTNNLIAKLDRVDAQIDTKADVTTTGLKVKKTAGKAAAATAAPAHMSAAAGKQQVRQTLVAAYDRALHEMQGQDIGMANSLAAQGKAEWSALAATGENTAANKGRLVARYLAKSNALEGQMDASFYAVTAKIEAQLQAQGIDPAPIISGYKAQYKASKNANKQMMMGKISGAMHN